MIILGVYKSHDAGAATMTTLRLIAAVAQERITRIKGDGLRFPAEAVSECLAQAGLEAGRIEAVAMSARVLAPRIFHRAFAMADGRRRATKYATS